MVDSCLETTEMEHVHYIIHVLVSLTIINDSVLWKWNQNRCFTFLFHNNFNNNILW